MKQVLHHLWVGAGGPQRAGNFLPCRSPDESIVLWLWGSPRLEEPLPPSLTRHLAVLGLLPGLWSGCRNHGQVLVGAEPFAVPQACRAAPSSHRISCCFTEGETTGTAK